MLGFVQHEEAVWNGSSADVAEGLDFNEALFEKEFVGLADGRFVLLSGLFPLGDLDRRGVAEEFEGIVDGLEPGAHFLVEAAGQETELIAHGDHGSADGEAVHFTGVETGAGRRP